MAEIKSWNPSCTLKHQLQEMRLNDEETDVVLVCGQERSCAHKLILIAASRYFRAMFQGSFKESIDGIVNLELEPGIIPKILDFIYLDKDANMAFDCVGQVMEVAKAAHMLQLIDLFHLCCLKAEQLAIPEDFPLVATLDTMYQNEHSACLLESFLAKYWLVILKENLHLSLEIKPLQILVQKWKTSKEEYDKYDCGSSDQISTSSMVSKIVSWVKEVEQERTQYITLLFGFIDVNQLSHSFIQSLTHEEIIQSNCRVLMQFLTSVLNSKGPLR